MTTGAGRYLAITARNVPGFGERLSRIDWSPGSVWWSIPIHRVAWPCGLPPTAFERDDNAYLAIGFILLKTAMNTY